jgi:hypothetical protein
MRNTLSFATVSGIQSQSKALRGVFLIAFIGLLGVLTGKHVVWPIVRVVGGAQDGEAPSAVLTDIGLNLVSALPAVLLLLGIGAAYRVFDRMVAGEIFSPLNVAGIRNVGASMISAAIAELVISPSLAGWIRGDTTIDFHFADWALAVAVLGLALAFIARVLTLANQIKAENDEIV